MPAAAMSLALRVAAAAQGCPAVPAGYTAVPGHCVGKPCAPEAEVEGGCSCAPELTYKDCSDVDACFTAASAACKADGRCASFALLMPADCSSVRRWQLFAASAGGATPNSDWYAFLGAGVPTPPPTPAPPPPGACSTDVDCSLNGACAGGKCVCDPPWKGDVCGVMGYKKTPVSGKSLYGPPSKPTDGPCVTANSTCDELNTWNGPVVGPVDGKYHLYNPIYRKGSLLAGEAVMHGVADKVVGPYTWNRSMDLHGGTNPAFVVYNDSKTGKTKYSLWVGGSIQLADSPDGPFTELAGSKYPGGNPAPVFHQGVWYFTEQSTRSISTAPDIGGPWTKYADVDHRNVPSGMVPEDPYMWIDKRGNWHVINHAYNTGEYENCAGSMVSCHFFSADGKTWHMLTPNVEPYGHTVEYEDGTSHTYTTLERPNIHFDARGQMTHLLLAADMVTGDAGCEDRVTDCPARKNNHCACTNCKYADHAGTIIIALDV